MNAIPGAMTTLETRPNTALLIIDVQVGVVDKAHDREAIVGNIAALVERARHSGAPVIWIQHVSEQVWRRTATPGASFLNLSQPRPNSSWKKLMATPSRRPGLNTILNDLEVGRLIIAGAQTDACIRSTLHGALVRGYDVTLAADAHTTDDLSAYGAPPPAIRSSRTPTFTGNIRPRLAERRPRVASAKIEF